VEDKEGGQECPLTVWPSLNEAQEICDSLAIPKTAKNLKPLEAPKVPAPIKPTADPFDSYEKAAQAVSKMMKPPKPVASSSKGKARLVERIWTPPFCPSPDLEHFENYEQSGFDWAAERMYDLEVYREESREPPVSLGDSGSIHDPEYNFDESDDDEDAPCQLGFIDRRMDVDDDIADAAGLEIPRERQVPLSRNKLLLTTPQCTTRSTSVQETKEPLDLDVDISVLQTLVNSMNKIELHTRNVSIQHTTKRLGFLTLVLLSTLRVLRKTILTLKSLKMRMKLKPHQQKPHFVLKAKAQFC
jgi:hypothetical protein